MGGRGMMNSKENRDQYVIDIMFAVSQGARLGKACDILNISIRTLQRWTKGDNIDKRTTAPKNSPKKLTVEEKKEILNQCNSKEFCDMTPNQIVPILAERGIYIACESSFYKALKENQMLNHRENSKPKTKKLPDELVANGPNQVLSWDITYLKTSIKGRFFYLYLFLDIWSRQIVGWEINESENGEIASKVINRICKENNVNSIKLHSDNGSPMKCANMLSTMQNLGVIPSYSRPSVSNDNPYSESLFKTLKYRPSYPSVFNEIDDANKWVSSFVAWYNTKHHHSGIKFVTPEQRHRGDDIKILERRKKTYQEAKKRNPLRWAGNVRNWEREDIVKLNYREKKNSLAA